MKVTSRERPHQLLETVKTYIQLAANTRDMVWLFSFDRNDSTANRELIDQIASLIGANLQASFGATDQFHVYEYDNAAISISDSTCKIDAINRDVNNFKPHWDILLNISDDQCPVERGYDDTIRRAMPDDLDASLWFYDGAQHHINTQEIQGRTYYQRFNYIYNPSYKSFYCDNESTDVAVRLGKSIRRPQCIIKHFHPAITKDTPDQLYKRNDKYWHEDKATYHTRLRAGFN